MTLEITLLKKRQKELESIIEKERNPSLPIDKQNSSYKKAKKELESLLIKLFKKINEESI
jgi:hypothetical protein